MASASGEITIVARTCDPGGWLPAEIVVRGEKVRLKVTSGDVTHGLRIRGLKVESGPVTPGSYQIIEFVPNKTGTFPYLLHSDMQPRAYGDARGGDRGTL